jgi:hypothetical protein
MTNPELVDEIESILKITSKNYFKTSETSDVVLTTRKKSTTPQQFEEDHIQLMTIRNIKAVCSKSNERSFVIQCVMDEYEESNATIQARHPKLLKDDTYMFEASKKLLMCMPFDFINGLKDKKWTHIDYKWLVKLMNHLVKAQSSNIKQIRFIRHIGRLDFYHNSRKYDIEHDCHIYEIFLENKSTHYVNFGQINDIVGDEEWLQGEVNCLCNIASSQIISLSLGAKKKESTHSDALCICVGDRVSVEKLFSLWTYYQH